MGADDLVEGVAHDVEDVLVGREDGAVEAELDDRLRAVERREDLGVRGAVAADGVEGGGVLGGLAVHHGGLLVSGRGRGTICCLGAATLTPGLHPIGWPPMSAGGGGRLPLRGRGPTPPGGSTVPTIVPNLWFATEAEQAAAFYVSVFPDSEVLETARYPEGGPGEPGTVMTVAFSLGGQRFVGINGGSQNPFTEAVSFAISCATQDEVDRYWAALTDGGEEVQCGWLRDRFGVSWQVVPEGMQELFADADPARAQRAVQAMLGMKRLDLAALRAAADAAPA